MATGDVFCHCKKWSLARILNTCLLFESSGWFWFCCFACFCMISIIIYWSSFYGACECNSSWLRYRLSDQKNALRIKDILWICDYIVQTQYFQESMYGLYKKSKCLDSVCNLSTRVHFHTFCSFTNFYKCGNFFCNGRKIGSLLTCERGTWIKLWDNIRVWFFP